MQKLVDLSIRLYSTNVKLFFKTKRTNDVALPGGAKFKNSKSG